MGDQVKIAGGVFVVVLLILTLQPFDDRIHQEAANASLGKYEKIILDALVEFYDYIHAGLIFIVAAFTLWEAWKN